MYVPCEGATVCDRALGRSPVTLECCYPSPLRGHTWLFLTRSAHSCCPDHFCVPCFGNGGAAVEEAEAWHLCALWHRKGGMGGQEGRQSASSATPPLPQQPVSAHLAFALEGERRGVWGRERFESLGGSGRSPSPCGSRWGQDRGFLAYLHFYIPSKLQLKTIKLLEDSLGLRRQVDLQGWEGRGGMVRDAEKAAGAVGQKVSSSLPSGPGNLPRSDTSCSSM